MEKQNQKKTVQNVKKSVKKKPKKQVQTPVIDKYRTMTVRDIVDFVTKFKEHFPKGLDTPVFSGDFECNYTHLKHELQVLEEDNEEPAIVLAYEMQEGAWED